MARILVLTNMFPPHHYGGYELLCEDVVERWRHDGHDVGVLTAAARLPGVEDPPNERARGVRRELELYFRDSKIVWPPMTTRYRTERHNQRSLASALDDIQPEVVSVWHMGALSLSLLATLMKRRLPIVLVIGDLWLLYGPKVDAWLRAFVDRPRIAAWTRRLTRLPTSLGDLGSAAAFCFASDWLEETIEQQGQWKLTRSSVVHHGINQEIFHSRPAESRAWQWRLLYVGRLDERKGVHVAVRALAKLPPEASLTILGRGDDDYLASLKRLAAEIGVGERVHFGEAARRALPSHYGAADVLLFPSLWDEPFGLVPLEAMACGAPVVTTATGGSSEFSVDEVNCLVVPAGDEQAIADAVVRIAGDESLRTRLTSAGRATAEVFGVDAFATELGAWHLAAASGFRDGLPPRKPSARTKLEGRGVLVGGR